MEGVSGLMTKVLDLDICYCLSVVDWTACGCDMAVLIKYKSFCGLFCNVDIFGYISLCHRPCPSHHLLLETPCLTKSTTAGELNDALKRVPSPQECLQCLSSLTFCFHIVGVMPPG